jgi:hypothetical protein
MSKPSTVKTLPKPDREWLEKQLLERNFADYDGLTAALAERGLEISRSALGRFGKEFKNHVEKLRRATDMAVLLSEEVGDDANAIGDATTRMMQMHLFEAMQDYDFTRLQAVKPHQLIAALADLNRASVSQKKWMSDVRTKTKAVAESVEKTTKKAGLSTDAIAQIKRDILGIGK